MSKAVYFLVIRILATCPDFTKNVSVVYLLVFRILEKALDT